MEAPNLVNSPKEDSAITHRNTKKPKTQSGMEQQMEVQDQVCQEKHDTAMEDVP